MNNIDIAVKYIEAIEHQCIIDDDINNAFRRLNADNAIFSTTSMLLKYNYESLVKSVVGDEVFEWIDWWMYETDFGSKKMEFMYGHVEYDPTTMDARAFIEIISK